MPIKTALKTIDHDDNWMEYNQIHERVIKSIIAAKHRMSLILNK